jgi:two-component system, OmpR family, response regulator
VRPHVLIVEDSALVVGALRLLLEETGHRVSAAACVQDAVSTTRQERPDVMLLDLTLRDENGLAVLDELRRTNDAPPVTVAVTGHDEPEVRERCLRAGCREVLVKPINAMELPRQIERWLGEEGQLGSRSVE